MARMNYKPSKPAALLSAVIGAGMLVFALTRMGNADPAFMAFWCVALVAIVGFNLWAAFSKKGSIATFVSAPDDEATGGGDSGKS